MRRLLLFAPLLIQGRLVAQSCDSLVLTTVRYTPFGDGLHATLHNGLTGFLGGPMFDAFDANGDTLVLNAFNFFGMGPGTTEMHQLHLVNGAALPASPFTGSLVLHYTDSDGSHTCVFPMDSVDLCPPEDCPPVAVYAYAQGDLVESDLDWSVTDAENVTQANGVLHLDTSGFGYSIEELCLPPGLYTLQMHQAIPAGNIIEVGMTLVGLSYIDGTNTPLPIGGSVDHPFAFYELCAQQGQGIPMREPGSLQLVLDGRNLHVASTDGRALGPLVLLDGLGRTVRVLTTTSASLSTDLSGLAPGTCILKPLTPDAGFNARRFILQ